jgi:regulatory protein
LLQAAQRAQLFQLRHEQMPRSKSGPTVAQSWRMSASSSKSTPKPYDAGGLERLALRYVERFATTRAKLTAYLHRKLRERGWEGDGPAPVDSLVERFAERGYVNDAHFAEAKTASLLRRGYGARRIAASLRAAGIDDAVTRGLQSGIKDGAERSALAFARRRKIGPFAHKPLNPDENRKALAAMLRAGHDIAIARRILACADGGEDYYADDIPGHVDCG